MNCERHIFNFFPVHVCQLPSEVLKQKKLKVKFLTFKSDGFLRIHLKLHEDFRETLSVPVIVLVSSDTFWSTQLDSTLLYLIPCHCVPFVFSKCWSHPNKLISWPTNENHTSRRQEGWVTWRRNQFYGESRAPERFPSAHFPDNLVPETHQSNSGVRRGGLRGEENKPRHSRAVLTVPRGCVCHCRKLSLEQGPKAMDSWDVTILWHNGTFSAPKEHLKIFYLLTANLVPCQHSPLPSLVTG